MEITMTQDKATKGAIRFAGNVVVDGKVVDSINFYIRKENLPLFTTAEAHQIIIK